MSFGFQMPDFFILDSGPFVIFSFLEFWNLRFCDFGFLILDFGFFGFCFAILFFFGGDFFF